MKDYPPAVRYLVRIMLIFAVITVLSVTKQLLVPVAISIFMAYLLYPAASWLEQKGLHRIPTNFIVIIAFMILLVGTLLMIIQLVSNASSDLPQLKEQLSSSLRSIQQGSADFLEISKDQLNDIITSAGLNGDYIGAFIEAGRNAMITLALIPVYTFLLLFYRDKFKNFISMLVKKENEETTAEIIEKAAEVVPKYLKGLIAVCLVLVFINWLGFELIGVRYPLLLGLIAAVFNLIPYLGTVLGYGAVFIFVFVVQEPAIAGAVVIQFFVVQFLENNVLTPNITGSYVRINPLVIIFSLIAGGLIWGLPGMFLVIPTLGVLKIIFESIDELKPYAYLIGTQGTENHSITIQSLRKRFGWEE